MAKFSILIVLLLVGCSNNNASKSYLYKDINGTKEFTLVTHESSLKTGQYGYSGNPIFISKDSKFTIKLEDVFTGILKNDKKNDNGKSNINSSGERRKFNNLKGKELWMLTTISSLDPNDPLETNSKRYFKSTNVKFDAEAFSFFPLDSNERYIFTHESDMSYRVTIQLFEVDGFELKSEFAKISNSPGIVGIAKDGLQTITSTLGSVAGDIVVNWIKQKSGETLALERFLLKSGATQEFYGQFIILRENNFFDNLPENENAPKSEEIDNIYNSMKDLDPNLDLEKKQLESALVNYKQPFVAKSYLLYDHFKRDRSCELDYTKKSTDQGTCGLTLDKFNDDAKSAYIVFSVMEGYSPKATVNDEGEIIKPQNYRALMKVSIKLNEAFEKLKNVKLAEEKLKLCETEAKEAAPQPENEESVDSEDNEINDTEEADETEQLDKCAELEADLVKSKSDIPNFEDHERYVDSIRDLQSRLKGINLKEWTELIVRPSD